MVYKIIGCLLLVLTFGANATEDLSGEYTIVTKRKTLNISEANWKKLTDSEPYAKSFQQNDLAESHKYGRVVTVFLTPMSEDRKIGIRVSENEYLEFMIVSEGSITAQTRIDKGEYWLLCRETFLSKPVPGIDPTKYDPLLSRDQNEALWMAYQNSIDRTRYILLSQF